MSNLSRPAMLRGFLAVPVALMIAAAPALAEPQDETVVTAANPDRGTVTRTMHVSTAGLDLMDGRDYARFSRRIAAAADTVCADQGLWGRFDDVDYRTCRANAVATAMAQRTGSQRTGE